MKRVFYLLVLLLFLLPCNPAKSTGMYSALSERSAFKSASKEVEYYSAEDESASQSGTGITIAAVAGAVVVVAVAGYFLLRKKQD